MISQTILNNLLKNETYTRHVLPYIKPEYFTSSSERITFEIIRDYIQSYNKVPNIPALRVELANRHNTSQNDVNETRKLIETLVEEGVDTQWLIDQTEKFCQDRAIEVALYNSVDILKGEDKKHDKGMIPKLLSDALAVSFDNHIGHDLLDDWAARYKFYHTHEERIPFDIEILNKITSGGLPRKTLNLLLAGTNVGKSLVMCHMAAANLLVGKNVLYITMEMSEERIAERIDANLLDVPINELMSLTEEMYQRKIERVRDKTPGKLVIKEYPTAGAGSDNFRFLLQELRLKKRFIPDIVYIDYLNICKSSRVKYGNNVNSYLYVMMIAQEVRGLAIEEDIPIVTASQLNREGFVNSDPGLENISESFGTAAAADLILAITSNEELTQLNQIGFKQLKNRYNSMSYYSKFHVGCDRAKMRLYNLDLNQDPKPPISASNPASLEDLPVFERSGKFDKKFFDEFK